MADLHRPKIQAVRANAGPRIDHGRLQLDLLRASGSVVGDVECGRKRTDLVGIGGNLDDATAPGRQLGWTAVKEGEIAGVGPGTQGQGDSADGKRGGADVLHRHVLLG